MKLFLVNADDIYFPQIKIYFREIVSSYDNGNYRSAIVMLYSTIVCDLLLKLKELSEVYSDEKAEKMLEYVEKQRKSKNKSAWEWELIEKIYKETELLNDEAYTMVHHIYDLRNFSAHPALTDDYELVSPTPEMTVAYIKKSLEDILIKPSVFAQNIVNRMSDDIAAKKEIYYNDGEAFKGYLNRAYFQKMSIKMKKQVFKAFWKFVFIKVDEDIFKKNRLINRKVLEFMLSLDGDIICKFIEENSNYFKVAQDTSCLNYLCILLGYYPRVYQYLEQDVHDQVEAFDEKDCRVIKWFVNGDLEQHITMLRINSDIISSNKLDILKNICIMQGQPRLFNKFLIKHYSQSSSYSSAKNRFDYLIEPYMNYFTATDFIELFDVINRNNQIYNYGWQTERNDKILKIALPLLPAGFDFSQYEHFDYTKTEKEEEADSSTENSSPEGEELEFEPIDDETLF